MFMGDAVSAVTPVLQFPPVHYQVDPKAADWDLLVAGRCTEPLYKCSSPHWYSRATPLVTFYLG